MNLRSVTRCDQAQTRQPRPPNDCRLKKFDSSRAFPADEINVEHLRRSIEGLEPPVCDACQLEMKWYHSPRMQAAPDLIAHFFSCPNCGRVKEVKTKMQAQGGKDKPSKLSAPRPPGVAPPDSAA